MVDPASLLSGRELGRLEAMTDMIVDVESDVEAIVTVDEFGSVVAYNAAAGALFGYAAADVLGGNVSMLMPDAYRVEGIGTGDGERSSVAPGALCAAYEVAGHRQDGSVVALDLAVSEVTLPPHHFSIGVVRLAQIRISVEALRASEETLRVLLEGSVGHALFLTDGAGHITSWNLGAQRLFGHAEHEVNGQHVGMLHPQGIPGADALLCRADGRGFAEDDGPRVRRDRSTFLATEVVTAVRASDGSVRSYVIVTRDVTERQVQQLARAREAEQLARRRRLEAVGQLAGGVAHDFNNLLTVIAGTASLVADAVQDGNDVSADIEAISDAAMRGAVLTRQLLTFSRVQIPEAEVVDLCDVVASVADLVRRSLGAHIELHVRCAPDLPPVLINVGQLEEVIVNLAVNARDVMVGGGSLIISVRNSDRSTESADGSSAYVRLIVTDTGTGMTPAVAARAFEPYFTTKGPADGSGLGLSIVYAAVTSAGGFVHIASHAGSGTSVICDFPASLLPPAARIFAAADVELEPGGRTVLVVDDDAAILSMLQRVLEASGYRVLAAESGEDALAVLARADIACDLVVSDDALTGMSGHALVERLTALRPDLRSMLISGHANERPEQGGGPQDVFEKPFTSTAFLRAVASALGDPTATPA
jgi:PAS domain S-box-containing protein